MFTKFWARLAKWGRHGGGRTCPRRRGFFCKQYQTTFQQLRNSRFLPNLATTRKSVMKRGLRTEIYEKFPFRGHLPPKPQTWRGSNRHLTQSRLQVKGSTAEKYCLLRVVVQRLGSFRGLVNFLVRRNLRLRSYTVYGTSNLPNFRILAYFPPYKTPKKYLPVTSLQPMGYIAE